MFKTVIPIFLLLVLLASCMFLEFYCLPTIKPITEITLFLLFITLLIVFVISFIKILRTKTSISDIRTDTYGILFFMIVSYAISWKLDIFEKIYELTRFLKWYKIDELFVVVGLSSLLVLIISRRRWLDLKGSQEELRRTQSNLKKNEERYRFLFENMDEVLWLCDMDYNLIFISPAVIKITGYSAEELQNTYILGFYLESEQERIIQLFLDRINSGDYSSFTIVAESRKRNEELLWIETTVNFIVEKGIPQAIQGVLRDITDKKITEAALERSEERYKFLVENSHDIYWQLKPDFTYEYISPAVKWLLGYDPEFYYGSSAVEVLHPDDAKILYSKIAKRYELEDFKPETMVVRQKDSKGVYQYFEICAYFVMEDGIPHHVQGVSRKVTSRIETERALKESEAKFRLLAENTLDCIWMADLDSNFTYINPSVYEMTGYTVEEYVGSNLKQHVTRTEYDKIHKLITDAIENYYNAEYSNISNLESTLISRFETTMIKKDGEPFDVEVYAKLLIGKECKIIGVQGTTRDITERKKIESNLYQARKMSYLGEMASGIAHEINNPLAGIIAYSELLLEEYERGDSNYEMVEDILNNSTRIEKIVHNLLRFARAEVSKVPSDVKKIVESGLSHLEDKLKRYNITVITNFVDTGLVLCDPNILEQVFINLFSNAIYAIDKKENAPEELRLIEVRTSSEETWILVKIMDHGIGISEANLPKIFDPFFTTKAIGQGTGLGMSLAYGFIRDHGGTITVNSIEGEWTEFTVKLPVYEE